MKKPSTAIQKSAVSHGQERTMKGAQGPTPKPCSMTGTKNVSIKPTGSKGAKVRK